VSFILTFPNLETEDLLKQEVRLKYPMWKVSFSKKGFISYKVDKELCLEELKTIQLIFSKRIALFQKKIGLESLEESDECFDLETLVLRPSLRTISTDSSEMHIRIGKEIWIASYLHKSDRLALLAALPAEAPSRAYLKLAELKLYKEIKFEKSQIFIELGSAPGGMSYYVCSVGAYLYAVDPGLMDPLLTKNYPEHFKHVKKSVFDLRKHDLPDTIHWLMVDLNLEALVSLEETLKLALKYKGPNFRGIFINLKTPRVEDVGKIQTYAAMIREAGFDNYQFFQLPSHRREFAALIQA
jgi:hypothetical protein